MLEAFGLTDLGCVRQNNEDAFLVDSATGLYLLADGMGGAQAGEHAARLAVDSVASHIRARSARSLDQLTEAFRIAHDCVFAEGARNAEWLGMGTTLVGALDLGSELAIASVGDSRAYAFANGTLSLLTQDQTWANEVGSRIGVSAEMMRTHPMRHVLTMAIGMDTPLRVNSYTLPRTPGAVCMLSSDGLHGVVDPETITKGLNSGKSLEAGCHYLIDAARSFGGPDNITVVLLRWAP
jgi:protein phosphatase